ncbi:MAG TPA: aspartate kinase [Phototrophicaceae bacterium]|jgi:aspartate kinase|nr:aspartate kinase [Phototrophicaceae bacterium]
MKTVTMKFGGTSVGSPEAIGNVVYITQHQQKQGNRTILVVSAMSGVTDTLLSSITMAIKGDRWGYLSVAEKLRERHHEAVNRLILPGDERERVTNSVNKLLDEYTELCQAIGIMGEATPRIRDAITSFGERLSARLVAATLRHKGVNAKAYDASQFIMTDNNYQNAAPIWEMTEKFIEERLLPILDSGITPVITGFIGATPDGAFTTLGRGGSDFSGAIFAAYTHSDELIIWTDVDGVMTTDPRLDKRARVLPYVSYQEVGELAYYGAKVLHPKTVQPIMSQQIPLYVRNTFNPDYPGTLIGAELQPSSTVVKAVTSIRHVSMLTITGKGMIGVPGMAGRAFLSVAQAGANILMISQSSSEQSICFIATSEKADDAKDAVEKEFRSEMSRKDVDGVDIEHEVVIVTVVGAGMRGTPGIAGRVFSALGSNLINVLAIAQGSSECSISFVVAEKDLEHAVVTLHDLALEAVPA